MDTNVLNRINALSSAKPIVAWRPTQGDKVVGELVGSRKVINAYGSEQHQILLDDGTRVHAVWLSDWLKKTLRANGVVRGDVVALQFLGKQFSKTGSTFNAFELTFDRAVVNDDFLLELLS